MLQNPQEVKECCHGDIMASEKMPYGAPIYCESCDEYTDTVIVCVECDSEGDENESCLCTTPEEAAMMASMKSLYDAEVKYGIHVPQAELDRRDREDDYEMDEVLLDKIRAEKEYSESLDREGGEYCGRCDSPAGEQLGCEEHI